MIKVRDQISPLTFLIKIPRIQKQVILMVLDTASLILCVFLAYSLRFGHWHNPNSTAQLFLMGIIPLLALPIFLKFGLYRAVIRYVGDQALWAIVKSLTLTTLIWSFIAFMTQLSGAQGIPRTVPGIFWLLGVVIIASTRFLGRFIFARGVGPAKTKNYVLIYGAGTSGRQLAASLKRGNDLQPLGFIDDDASLSGKDIDGFRVYSPKQIAGLISHFGVKFVIVTLSSVSNKRRREVVAFLEKLSVKVRVLPSISSIAEGRHLVNMIREVEISDLLGRDPVDADPVLLSQCIQSKSVLVTGAGGSIGSELCRQIAALKPVRLVLLESNEGALFQIHRNLLRQTEIEIIPCLGSVNNRRLVSSLLKRYQIDTIYHAAAHKHVPLIESNLLEGIRNNIFGTLTLTQAAFDFGVKTFVLISTDKAVRPTSIMGATKRFAELIVQNFDRLSKMSGSGQVFCSVRFGNVLGSSGSVVPIFKEQIAQGGPITVTHPEIIRYFMSIHEAVELVIQAGSLAKGGDIFLLDMGEPVKIVDLARNMIRLAGFKEKNGTNPSGDIEILFTGLRPGEKLYEELLISSADAQNTVHPKILRAEEPLLSANQLDKFIALLRAGMIYQDAGLIKSTLFESIDKSGQPNKEENKLSSDWLRAESLLLSQVQSS